MVIEVKKDSTILIFGNDVIDLTAMLENEDLKRVELFNRKDTIILGKFKNGFVNGVDKPGS
jgi:hypothetical protein